MIKVVVFALAAAFLIGRSRHQVGEKDDRPNGADQHAAEANEIEPYVDRSSQNTEDHQRRRHQEKRRKSEEWYRRASFIVSAIVSAATVGALAFAALAWIEAHKQAVEARRQADAALATSRPWVTIGVALSEPLRSDSEGLHITVDGNVHNVGHSPALAVKDAVFAVVGRDALMSVERTCQSLSDVLFDNVGRVLFSEDVDKASSSQVPIKMHLTFASSALNAAARRGDGETLSVAACVVYDFGDGVPHHTFRILDLRAPDAAGVAVRLTANSPVPKDIPILVDRISGDRAD